MSGSCCARLFRSVRARSITSRLALCRACGTVAWFNRVVQSMVAEPLEWVREQGMVLQSAHGAVLNLAEYVAGEPIRGSWWGHPAGHEIVAILAHRISSPRG